MSPMDRGLVCRAGGSGWVVQSRKYFLVTAALCLVTFSVSSTPANADLLAYYTFNSGANDFSGNNYNGTFEGTAAITNAQPMFGAGALLNATSSRVVVEASHSDGEAPLLNNASFKNLSVGMWLKADNWAAGTQYIAGKAITSGNTGWRVFKNGNNITFQGWGTNGTSTGTGNGLAANAQNINGINNTTDYIHYVATFESTGAATSVMKSYVNGILQNTVSLLNQGEIVGQNNQNLQIGSWNNSTSFAGRIDDFVLLSDTASAEEIAVTHGLGRLAGVNFSQPIADVLNAYINQGSAAAGGATWYYQANVAAPGTLVGTIGGSLANNDAFIVLSDTGAGVSIVPEPSCLFLAGLGVIGVVCLHRRRRK